MACYSSLLLYPPPLLLYCMLFFPFQNYPVHELSSFLFFIFPMGILVILYIRMGLRIRQTSEIQRNLPRATTATAAAAAATAGQQQQQQQISNNKPFAAATDRLLLHSDSLGGNRHEQQQQQQQRPQGVSGGSGGDGVVPGSGCCPEDGKKMATGAAANIPQNSIGSPITKILSKLTKLRPAQTGFVLCYDTHIRTYV